MSKPADFAQVSIETGQLHDEPSDEFDGYLQASYGNYKTNNFEGAVSVPINEQLAARPGGISRPQLALRGTSLEH